MSTNPPPDDLDRDALYASELKAADTEEPDEYELEPLDESAPSAEQFQTQALLASLHQRIDIDEVMREEERRLETKLLDDLVSELRFKFGIKHLLAATAIVAILVSVAHYNLWASVLVAVLGTVGGLLGYLARKERQHQAALHERRQRRREQLQSVHPEAPLAEVPAPAAAPRESLPQSLAKICTLQEFVIIAAICSIVLIVLISSLGAPITAACLGLIALGGIVLQVFGIDMPRLVALVWGILMLAYVVVCTFLALSGKLLEQVAS